MVEDFSREVNTCPLYVEQLWSELRHLAEFFVGIGLEDCDLLFGFAWGNEYYETNVWNRENVRLKEVEEMVRNVEKLEYGELGLDELFVRFQNPGVEFQFCNESDIHLYFNEVNNVVLYFYARWQEFGYEPGEIVSDSSTETLHRGELRREGELRRDV